MHMDVLILVRKMTCSIPPNQPPTVHHLEDDNLNSILIKILEY